MMFYQICQSSDSSADTISVFADGPPYEHELRIHSVCSPRPTLPRLPQVGARLISHAGSLTNLAKYPASTVQILGAEKALFRYWAPCWAGGCSDGRAGAERGAIPLALLLHPQSELHPQHRGRTSVHPSFSLRLITNAPLGGAAAFKGFD